MAPTLNKATAQVAKYLESDLVYHQTEYMVMQWAETGKPDSDLEQELRLLVEGVNKRRDGGPIDLGAVDWEYLIRRYVEMFDG